MDERSSEERFLALQPKRLKVVELKQHLAARGLGVSGRKDVLVARLEAAIVTAQTEAMSLQAEALTLTSTPTLALALALTLTLTLTLN